MKKNIILGLATILLVFGLVGVVSAYNFPSTNELNKNGENPLRPGIGPHVNLVETNIGEVKLEFVMPYDYWACFEYRSDGDTGQAINEKHFNPWLEDDLYSYYCIKNGTREEVIHASEYVEVRLAFGAERDWDFDWTGFDVLPEPGEIILPTPGQEIVRGDTLYLEAKDVGVKNGRVSWAVRFGSCAANTGTVAGNVDGFNTGYAWKDGIFKSELDTSGWEVGEYCFVFNPREGGRYTQWFFLVENNPTIKQECMKGGWESFGFRNQGQCIRFVETGKDSR